MMREASPDGKRPAASATLALRRDERGGERTEGDKQIAALVRHESQVPGLNVASGQTIEQRMKKGAAELAQGYGLTYGAAFRRLIARR